MRRQLRKGRNTQHVSSVPEGVPHTTKRRFVEKHVWSVHSVPGIVLGAFTCHTLPPTFETPRVINWLSRSKKTELPVQEAPESVTELGLQPTSAHAVSPLPRRPHLLPGLRLRVLAVGKGPCHSTQADLSVARVATWPARARPALLGNR